MTRPDSEPPAEAIREVFVHHAPGWDEPIQPVIIRIDARLPRPEDIPRDMQEAEAVALAEALYNTLPGYTLNLMVKWLHEHDVRWIPDDVH